MIVIVLRQFQKDVQKQTFTELNNELLSLIELLEEANSIRELSNVKKMKGFGNYYRIRIGDYRVGCRVEKNTIELMRLAHRKDIYSIFP